MIKWKSFLPVFLAFELVSFRFQALASEPLYSLEMGATYVCHPPSAQAMKKKDRNTHPQHPVAHDDLGGCIRQNDAEWCKWCKSCPEQQETASICAWEHGCHDQNATCWSVTGRIFRDNRCHFGRATIRLPARPCKNKSIHIAYLVVSTHLKNIEKY